MLENEYQDKLIKRIKLRHPDAFILKNDSNYLQGIPDLLVLCEGRWAMLEVKRSARAKQRPNQDYYVDFFNGIGYASFIYPENEEAVLNDLQLIFGAPRQARRSKR